MEGGRSGGRDGAGRRGWGGKGRGGGGGLTKGVGVGGIVPPVRCVLPRVDTGPLQR